MIQIVSWLWDNGIPHPKKHLRFTPHHVNVLKNMVKRNLKIPHEFVCITNLENGFDDDVRVIPLWGDLIHMGGCYVRLKAFSTAMADIIGQRFCWIDIDSVITGDITPLLDIPDDFKMWGDTNPWTPYNGSMVLMNAGARAQVWNQFDQKQSPQMAKQMRYVGTDQAWISACLGKGEPTWNCADGVYSYRMHIRKRESILPLPDNARIVFFHGSTDPSQPEIQRRLPWVVEHWR